MAGSNRTRAVDDLLARTRDDPPSFTVHLHQEHWVLNSGSKFLYHNQTACILDDIRANRIPVDFLDLFDSAKVPFYDGCMIVELLDYRPQRNKEPTPEKPDRTRVVLHPNSETLWSDICSLNSKYGGKWTDLDAIEIEAKIIHATAPPLCLDPDPHLSRIVNHILRATAPTVPNALKRKAATLEPEDDENEKSRRAKIMAFSNPTRTKLHNPNYRLLDTMLEKKRSKSQTPAPAAVASGQQSVSQSQPQPQPPPQPPQPAAQAPVPQPKATSPPIPSTADKKPIHQRPKTATPQAPYAVPAYVQASGSHTPMPPQPAANTQFIHHHINPHPATQTPVQTQTYAGSQTVTEPTKPVPTPAQPPPQPQGRHPQTHALPYAHATPQPVSHASPPAQASTPQQTIVHQNIASQPQVAHQTMPPHIQQPPRPPSQAQMLISSQAPMPIQPHQPHLQPTQTIPSPVQRHSPHHRPPSQPQHQQIQPTHAPQSSPLHHSKTIQRTPRLSHSPVVNQATTPRQYAPSPKPAPSNVPGQVPGRTGPTPQPPHTPVVPPAQVYQDYMRMRGQPQLSSQQQQQHTGGIVVNGSSQPVQVPVQQPPPQTQTQPPPQQQQQPQQLQQQQPPQIVQPPNGNQIRMTPQQIHYQYQLARAGRAATPASGGQVVMNPNGGPGASAGMTASQQQQAHAQAQAQAQAANRIATPQFQAALQAAAAARGISPQQFQHYTPQQQLMLFHNLQRPAIHAQNQAAHAQAQAQAQAQQQPGGMQLTEQMRAVLQHHAQTQAQAHHHQAQVAAQGGQPNQMKPAQGQGQGVQPGQQPNAAAAAAGMPHQYYLPMGYPSGYGWNHRMMMAGAGGQGAAAAAGQQQQGQGQGQTQQQQVQAQQMAMAAAAAMGKNGGASGQVPNR